MIKVDDRILQVYTLGEAAKATGMTKTAIQKAIKKGRISAGKNDLGHYVIDPSELHRIYPVATNQNVESEQQETTSKLDILQQEIEFLRQQVQREREIANDLSRRLDEEATERRKLTSLLTYKEQEEKPEKKEGWFKRLLKA